MCIDVLPQPPGPQFWGSLLNPRGMRVRASLAAASALLVISSGLTLAQAPPLPDAPPPPAPAVERHEIDLPDGAVVPVRLETSLSSKTSRPGDRFSATVIYGRNDAGMPRGTKVEGVVREALPAIDDKPGVLDLDFRRVVFPNGDSRSLEASVVSLDNKSCRRSSSGYLVATKDKSKDRAKFIGIGAGAGLIIGAITRQNTIASVLLGAGAGYLYNELSKQKPGDVNLKAGSEFGVRMDRQIAFYGDRAYHRSPDDARYAFDDSGFKGDRIDRYNEDLDHQRVDSETAPKDDRFYQGESENPGAEPVVHDIGVMIDDRNVSFGTVKPYMRGSIPMIPLRAFAQAGEFDYTYDPGSQVIRARHGGIRLAVGSRIAIVNGERRRLDSSAELRNGSLFVPMQFAAMAVGGSAYWDAPTRTVVITTHESVRE